MRSICTSLLAAACLAVPAVTRAQVLNPHAPFAFTGPTRTYHLSGCGDGILSAAAGSPSVRIFCLDGTATIGPIAAGSRYSTLQTVLDLTGTRVNGFAGTFFDADYSNISVAESFAFAEGGGYSGSDGYGVPADLTGRTVGAYRLPYLFGGGDFPTLVPGSAQLGSRGSVYLGYVPPDAPYGPALSGRTLTFDLLVTETPEPATLALTLGGLAVLGGIVARRRRTV